MPLESITPIEVADSASTTPDSMSMPVAKIWWRASHSVADEGPVQLVEGQFNRERSEFVHGIKGETRNKPPGSYNGVVLMMVLIFLLVCSNYRYYATYFKTYAKDLTWGRGRKNAFDDRHTVSETRVLVSLVILLCLCEGMLLYSYISSLGVIHLSATIGVAVSAAAAVIYYVGQLIVYRCIGYLFGTRDDSEQLVRAFNATQTLLGAILPITALPALFYPEWAGTLALSGLICYVAARGLFIYKGFIIFYNNFLSSVYFILYLCAVEIIPVLLLFNTVYSVLDALSCMQRIA